MNGLEVVKVALIIHSIPSSELFTAAIGVLFRRESSGSNQITKERIRSIIPTHHHWTSERKKGEGRTAGLSAQGRIKKSCQNALPPYGLPCKFSLCVD